jgi:pyridoxal phosphate enzyme (YggS family)
MNKIAENLAAVAERIATAADANLRNSREITLVAVSKTHPREVVEEAFAAGQRVFGENKVQEAADKFNPPVRGAELHMVGHLQSNKTKLAAALFDRIHSIDSMKTARRLDKHLQEYGRTMKAFVQVNVAMEDQKSGVTEKDLPALLEGLAQLEYLKTDGLMILPPFFDDPEQSVPYFRKLRELRDRLTGRYGVELEHLSMGMTNDYAEAIAEGATFIRVGTAIFGQRQY